VFRSLKIGGTWGCPMGLSIWIKTGETSCQFSYGPLYDYDDPAPEASLTTNRRIIVTLHRIGFTVINSDGETITPDPDWDLS